jgi:hypothetical protein
MVVIKKYIQEQLSICELVTSGVPQGPILGVLLISINISDLFKAVKFSTIQVSADERQC